MYKKIICPVDFTPVSNNSLAYAAQLAKKLQAGLHLLNVKTLVNTGPVPAGVMVEADAQIAGELMKATRDTIMKTHQVECTSEVDVTRESMEQAIVAAAGEDGLVVMGTDGADSLFQYFFGTNTYHVIKNAKCPVVVVPDNAVFEPVGEIVFAWDYSMKNIDSFSVMKAIADALGAKITLLHISKDNTEISNQLFDVFREQVIREMGGDAGFVRFERIFSGDITNSIAAYMNQSKAQMLALTHYDHGWMHNLFRQSVVKNLTTNAAFPTIILHA